MLNRVLFLIEDSGVRRKIQIETDSWKKDQVQIFGSRQECRQYIKRYDLAAACSTWLGITDTDEGADVFRKTGILCFGYAERLDEIRGLWKTELILEGSDQINIEQLEKLCSSFAERGSQICATERLIIRETVEEDAADFAVMYKTEAEWPRSEAAGREKIRSYQKFQYGYYGYGIWTVACRETGAVIGRAGYEYIELDGVGTAELGYWIRPEMRRKGYALEACQAIIQTIRQFPELEQAAVFIEEENQASLCVSEKLGFISRKVERQNRDKTLTVRILSL